MSAPTIRQLPVFSEFSAEELDLLASGLVERRVRQGDVIIEEDSYGTCLYLLLEGSVDIIKRTDDNHLPLISRLMPGAMFGEIGLLGAHKRTAKVIANEACTLFELPYEFLEGMVHTRPLFGVKIYRAIAATLSQKVGKTTADLISLIASSRMAALGEMTSGIAHEINNPLATIRLLADSIADAATSPEADLEQLADQARKIGKSVERIGKIIRGLRAVSRDAEDDPFVPTAVAELLEETRSFCEARFRNHNIQLDIPTVPPSLTIPGRGSQISQVLLNLLNNAHDAILEQSERWVKVEVEPRGNLLRITITDSGAGIPAPMRERIFHPFFTTKPSGKGTGLGLSISRKIIERHGGTIAIDANCANTRFVIDLPSVI